MIQRIVSLAIAASFFLGGLGSLVYIGLFATDWQGWMVGAAGAALLAGAYWLYEDYCAAKAGQTVTRRK